MKNGWQVTIDMFYFGLDDENHNILNSPIYKTEEEASTWYHSLDFSESEFMDNIDILMVHWVDNEIKETYAL